MSEMKAGLLTRYGSLLSYSLDSDIANLISTATLALHICFCIESRDSSSFVCAEDGIILCEGGIVKKKND